MIAGEVCAATTSTTSQLLVRIDDVWMRRMGTAVPPFFVFYPFPAFIFFSAFLLFFFERCFSKRKPACERSLLLSSNPSIPFPFYRHFPHFNFQASIPYCIIYLYSYFIRHVTSRHIYPSDCFFLSLFGTGYLEKRLSVYEYRVYYTG